MWNAIDEQTPKDAVILAYGYPLERFTLIRGELQVDLIWWDAWKKSWVANSGLFEPLGWQPAPEMPEVELTQRSPEGPPKYQVGQTVKMQSRYDGVIDVTITKVIAWPSGWWYALDTIDHVGHGNPAIGYDRILGNEEEGIFGRPARESELFLDAGLD